MPAIGERRTGSTETVEWDGQRWNPIVPTSSDHSKDVSFSNLIPRTAEAIGAIPDIARGLWNHPADTLKGFLSGSAEAATPAKLGTLAALTTGGASIPAQALTAAGAEALAEALQVGTGSSDAPTSFGNGVGRAVGAGATAGVVGGLSKAIPAGLRAIRGAGGMVDAGLEVGSHVPGFKTISKIGKAVRGLAGTAADEAPAGVEQFGPRRLAREVPGSSYRDIASETKPTMFGDMPIEPNTGTVVPEPQFSPRVVGKAPTLNDALAQALQGVREDSSPVTRTSGRLADTPSVRRMDELTQQFHQSDPKIPEFSFEAGRADVPGVTVGSAGTNPLTDKVDAATNGMMPFSQFSDSLDSVINDASADPLERTPGWRSKPTNAEKASMRARQLADPQWPYREINPDELFNRR